jgi:lysophospholipase L1-like esterase
MQRLRLFACVSVSGLLLGLAPAVASAQRDDPNQRWVGAWATSPLRPDPTGTTDAAALSRGGFQDQTLRQIVYPHAGGSQVRVRLSNTFGSQPLLIGQANIGLLDGEAGVASGSDHQLTFAGHTTVRIPVGAEAYTDPVALSVEAGRSLAISLYLPGPTGPVTWHATARQTLYLASGNQASSAAGDAFEGLRNVPSWYVLTGLDVAAAPGQAAVVTFGDSITDGTNSTQDANNRWPDYLARRLSGRPGNQLSVLDEGIGGNRVLSDTPTHVSALARINTDVLAQDGARYVILLEGINDIGQTCLGNADASADDIIRGYQQIITQLHLKGIKVFAGTLTPFMGALHDTPNAGYYCANGESSRGEVNTWIRNSGEFDGVIDFDQATRDPANPLSYLPAFDSGDHLHPNDAGYEAMANAMDLNLFAP